MILRVLKNAVNNLVPHLHLHPRPRFCSSSGKKTRSGVVPFSGGGGAWRKGFFSSTFPRSYPPAVANLVFPNKTHFPLGPASCWHPFHTIPTPPLQPRRYQNVSPLIVFLPILPLTLYRALLYVFATINCTVNFRSLKWSNFAQQNLYAAKIYLPAMAGREKGSDDASARARGRCKASVLSGLEGTGSIFSAVLQSSQLLFIHLSLSPSL